MTHSAGLPAGVSAGPPAGLLAGKALAQGLEVGRAPVDLDRAMTGFQAEIVRNRQGDRVPFALARAFAESERIAIDFATQRHADATADRWASALAEMQRSRSIRAHAAADASAAVLRAAQGCVDDLSTDRDLRLWASSRAGECAALAASCGAADDDALSLLSAYTRACLIEPPEPVGNRHVEGCVQRLQDAKWWRAQARKVWSQRREQRHREAGRVHRRAGLYISEEIMCWTRQRRQANREMLEALEALSDAGDVLSLTDAIDASVSNPAIRCTELMVRNAGMEFLSECRGDDALFLTWTLSSKWHAWTWREGRVYRNPNYEGATPVEAQARIAELWDKAVRRLRRKKIRWYGARFVQPHHDGCPHWHLLVFVSPDDRERLVKIMRDAALTDEPNEWGASRRRFDVELIDRAKGSAVGYVARYIARGVDGSKLDKNGLVDRDDDGTMHHVAEAHSVERVTAWASCWRIRLFQFIGLPPQTIWRELRRVRAPAEASGFALELLRAAADAGDYAEWLELMGGPCTRRKDQTAQTLRLPSQVLNCYGEPPANQVKGVQLGFEFAASVDPVVVAAVEAAEAAEPIKRRRRRAVRLARQDALSRPDVACRIASRHRLVTRERTWTIRRKGAAVDARIAATWTRVNNCPGPGDDPPGLSLHGSRAAA